MEYTSDYGHVKSIILRFKPDLLIIDMLQERTAIEIKNDKTFNKIPLLFMTGYSGNHPGKYPFANDIIEKPLDLNLLKDKIRKNIRKS